MKTIKLEESIGRTPSSYLIYNTMRTVIVSVLICLMVSIVTSQKDDLFKRFVSAVNNLLTSSGNSASKECKVQLKLLTEAYKNGSRSRASDILDAWSNFETRIQFGNTFDFGNFEECLKVDEKAKEIKGQYCLVQYFSKSNRTIAQRPAQSIFNYGWKHLDTRFGGAVCLPSICSDDIVSAIVKKFLNGSDYELASDYNQRDYCKTSNPVFVPPKSLNLLVCLLIILLLSTMLGTFYDISIRKRDEKKPNGLLISFSLIKNTSSLFNVNECRGNEIRCLNGIRALSSFSIVFLHMYYHHVMFPIQHPEVITEFTESLYGRVVSGITFSVDTFFVISGLLVTKAILADLDAGRFNIVKLYFQRYMRLTPTLAFVLLFYLNIAQYFIRHAPYAFAKDIVEPYEKYWWAFLLHLQVYTNPRQLILPYTWYISVDWQMFVLAPLLIYPVWKTGRKRLLPVFLSMLVFISLLFGYRASLQNHLLIEDLKITAHSNEPYFQTLYLPTHFRGSSFFIGMILGYFMYERNGEFIAKSKAKTMIMWTLAVIILAATCIPYMLGNFEKGSSPRFNAFFLAGIRLGWSIPMAWFIFAFHSGCGFVFEKIGEILAHRYWKPIAKLSFTLYIVHPTLQYTLLSSQKQPISFDHFQMINDFFGDLTLSALLAVGVHLFVEEPLTQFGKNISLRL